MEGPSKQRKPIFRKLKNGFNNFKASFSRKPGLSAQGESSQTGDEADVSRSRSNPEITITPIDNGGNSLVGSGVAAISGSNPEITITPIDNGGDSLVGSGVAAISDAQSKHKKTETNPTPEWEAWNINGDAVTQLREWGAARVDSKWSQLLKTMDRSLKSKTLDAFKNFIPDTPFPARTLVKALLSLVELGINIPLTQEKVYEFARKAIEYISSLVEVVGEELSVKEDLETVCAAVNEICLWAKERVSKKWVSDDLGDWESKFKSAQEKFLARTVTRIRVHQVMADRKAFIKETLASHVAAKYKHTDQSKSFCAKGTREELLKDIQKWLSPQPSNAERIFWVTGIPGSGKSTLSATIVEKLRENKTPVSAQYFISRNSPETVVPNKIIPTIAQQLANSSPTAARVLEVALENGYPATQPEQLLLDPIRELSKSRVVVILIDALDELDDAADSVMKLLSHIAPIDCDLPNSIRFIITSRPEHWTDISTSKNLKHAVFKQCSLATELSVTEVHNFVVARMKEIVTKRMQRTPHEPDWHDWPDPVQLRSLSNKANGLFHYAATALQWIKEQIRKDGTACQESVFKRFSEDGLDELDGLYKLILTSWEDMYEPTKDNNRRAARLDGFQHVMGTILVLREPVLIHEIIALLSDIPKDKFDVNNFLQQMCSVLIPGTTTSFNDATPQMHKSFRDYIISERAPPDFRILTRDAHFKIARSCLDIIVKAEIQRGFVCEYAVMYWYEHLEEAVWEGARCDDEGMWALLGEMVNKKVVGVWPGNWGLIEMFEFVATMGWQLLKQNTGEPKLVPVSKMLVEIKLALSEEMSICLCFHPPSSMLAILTHPFVSLSLGRSVCFCPPSSMFAIFTPPLCPGL